MRGIFITFEGGEGCGKSTQAKLLYKFLKKEGYKVILTKEPGGTKISDEIRKILLNPKNEEMKPNTEILLYFASRAQHIEEVIKPYLKKNYIVLSDRFSDSTMAYQGMGRGINFKIIEIINNFATGGVKPDLTFVFDISPEVALKRLKNKNRIDKESLNFHKKVREGFLKIAKLDKKRIKVINAEKKISEIHQEIQKIILNYFQHCGVA